MPAEFAKSQMKDTDCIAFLQWALPRLDLHWPGYRKVRRQVCRRIARRVTDLQLQDLAAYRQRLEADPAEWQALDDCCYITISRFFRDGRVFEALGQGRVLAVVHLRSHRQFALRAGDDLPVHRRLLVGGDQYDLHLSAQHADRHCDSARRFAGVLVLEIEENI